MTQHAPSSLRQFTVDEYHRLIETGILVEGEPIELLEGMLVRKMTRNPPHDTAMGKLEDQLLMRLPTGWLRRCQCAITLPTSEPEPDVTIARGNRNTYRQRHPGPLDIGLVAEVSDSSLDLDQGLKLRIYAEARIAVYWIVNIPDDRIEVYTQPTGTGLAAAYTSVQHLGPADSLVLTLGGVALPAILVSDILP